MWTKWEVYETPQLSDPPLIIGVSTSNPNYALLYSHASELAKFMIDKMSFKLFARVYSDAFPPEVKIDADGVSAVPTGDFYYLKGRHDLLVFTSTSSPSTQNYELAEEILNFAKSMGTNEVYSIGARFLETPSPKDVPEVLGFATHQEGVSRLREKDVKIMKDEPSLYFSSLVVGMAKLQAMQGYRLAVNHGEPRPHPKAVKAILEVLSTMLNFEIDVSSLDKKAEEMKEIMNDVMKTEEQNATPVDDKEIYR